MTDQLKPSQQNSSSHNPYKNNSVSNNVQRNKAYSNDLNNQKKVVYAFDKQLINEEDELLDFNGISQSHLIE